MFDMIHAPHTVTPDIESASDEYASRFAGAIGQYFLERQTSLVQKLLGTPAKHRLRILEVGGGHGQLTPLLLRLGHDVWLQGSDPCCFERTKHLLNSAHFVASSLSSLPFPEKSFDVVTAFRLLPHISNWSDFLREICRLARTQVIFDYASIAGLNVFTPMMFQVKRRIEGNTRPYFCHYFGQLKRDLKRFGFSEIHVEKQFFFPMGIHRLLNHEKVSRQSEFICQQVGLTSCFGSPGIVSARRVS